MQLISMALTVGLTTGLLRTPLAHAHEPGCQTPLVVTRLFPWPPPTAEMREALRAMSANREFAASLRPAIEDAVNQSSLDLMVRALLAPATVAQIRVGYGGDEKVGPQHPLATDRDGLRTTLAHSISAIADLSLQREWMRFMARDPDRSVRIVAAQTFLEWDDQSARDAFLLERNLSASEALDRILAAQRELSRVSPYARWYVIKALAPYREKPSDVLTRAIESLDDVTLLKHWYRDQIRARTVVNRLRDRHKHPLNEEQRRFSALDTGQLLHQIGNAATRLEVTREVESLSRKANVPALARYASEILLWTKLWDQIYEALRLAATGRPIEPEELVLRFAAITFDERIVRLARRAYDAESTHMFAPRAEWVDEDIKRLESRLRRY